MKKVYIQPLTEVVKINAEQLICQSIVGLGGDTGMGQGGEITEGTISPDSKEDFINVGDLW